MANADSPAPGPDPAPASTAAPAGGTGARIWVLALSAGLAAGLVAWAIGEAMLVPEAGYQDKKEKINILPEAAGIQNCYYSFGALGAGMGLGLGMAGGLIRQSVLRATMAGAAGVLLGAGAGLESTRLILPVYYAHDKSGEIVYSLMVHAGVWAIVAAAAGLTFAIGLGEWRRAPSTILGAAAAALLAALIYEFGGGMLFPFALTDRPISQTWVSRLLARVVVTVMVAAGVVLSAQPTGGRKSA
jgi:hypothetical protein